MLTALLLAAALARPAAPQQAVPAAARLRAPVPAPVRNAAGDLPPVIAFERGPLPNRARVTASDPEGGPVTLRLRNPPPGAVFAPAIQESSPVARTLDLSAFLGGEGARLALVFEAEDAGGRRAELVAAVGATFGAARLAVAEVTGDDVLDVIGVAVDADAPGAKDAGALYVWDAASAGGAPRARLRAETPRAGERIGSARYARGFELFDLDRDGVSDVLAASDVLGPPQSVRPVFHAWRGGASLSGERVADATLVAPLAGTALPRQLDLDGDGRCELVVEDLVPCPGAFGFEGVERAFVWASAPGARGALAPSATLEVQPAGAKVACGLGLVAAFDRDLTGDGGADLAYLATERGATLATTRQTLCVWDGSALAGTPAPARTLSVLGFESLTVVDDVTGDGIADVVGLQRTTGAALVASVFAGGAGLGSEPARARLFAPAPWTAAQSFFYAPGAADLDGDGARDVYLPVEGAGNGLVVWSGGAGLAGDVAGAALLAIAPSTLTADLDGDGRLDLLAQQDASLALRDAGASGAGATTTLQAALSAGTRSLTGPVWIADVTGDGLEDVVAQEVVTSFLGVPTAAPTRLHVWAAPFAPGAVAETASLTIAGGPFPTGEAELRIVAVADVSGDGVADVVAHRSGAQESFVWRGGASPGPLPDARLAQAGAGLALADLTGDGVLDLFEVDPEQTVLGAAGAGAVRVWAGGPGLAGDVAPLVTLSAPRPEPGDALGAVAPGAVSSARLADLDGNGALELLVAAGAADPAGVPDAGALVLWKGPIGPGAAGALFFVPDARPDDGLGR